MCKNLGQFADLADSLIELVLQSFDHRLVVLTSWLLYGGYRLATVLKLSQLLGSGVYVVNGAYYLSNLLAICVFALYLIFKILLERLVLGSDALDVTLKIGHLQLLLVLLGGHVCKRPPLVLLNLLHSCVDRSLAFIKLLILVFEVDEAIAETLDPDIVILIDVLVVCNDLLQELSVLSKVA